MTTDQRLDADGGRDLPASAYQGPLTQIHDALYREIDHPSPFVRGFFIKYGPYLTEYDLKAIAIGWA